MSSIAEQRLPAMMKSDVETLFLGVAAEMTNVYGRSTISSEPGLIFPNYRDGTLRACEQEAKVIFLYKALRDNKYRLSVETPTSITHSFEGVGKRSAPFDVSLFRGELAIHIEFKADNCRLKHIQKDLDKLASEQKMSGWFHTLGSADSGTLPTLARKFKDSITTLSAKIESGQRRDCLFAFYIIKKNVLLLRWLEFGGSTAVQVLMNAFNDLTLDTKTWTRHDVDGVLPEQPKPEIIVKSSDENDCA